METERIVTKDGDIRIQPKDRDYRKRHIQEVTNFFKVGTTERRFDIITVKEVKETEKAIQFEFILEEDGEIEEEEKEWIPKSQITETEDGIEIPKWLAKEKRIRKFTNEKAYVTEDKGE